MRLIELHLLVDAPATSANRDDNGQGKTIKFGDYLRTRWSSQSINRAIRHEAQRINLEMDAGFDASVRTRDIAPRIAKVLVEEYGYDSDKATKEATKKASEIFKADKSDKDESETSTETKGVFLISDYDVKLIASRIAGEKLKFKVTPKNIMEIALYGRFSPNESDLSVYGALISSHAMSTNAIEPELDYFIASDDVLTTTGAAHLGYSSISSATMYCYHAIDIDQLERNLRDFGVDESEITASLKVAIALMIEAILVARPSGKSRTMCGATHYPINVLVNYGKRNVSNLHSAFNKPIADRENAWIELNKQYELNKSKYPRPYQNDVSAKLTELNLDQIITLMTENI